MWTLVRSSSIGACLDHLQVMAQRLTLLLDDQQHENARCMLLQVRRIGASAVGGFAGVAVDGLALLEKLEAKLEEHPGQLLRASVELAKLWRQVGLLFASNVAHTHSIVSRPHRSPVDGADVARQVKPSR
jgi:hypothetical protein